MSELNQFLCDEDAVALRRCVSIDQISSTEYCEDFDVKREALMIQSYYKYGALRDNYGGHGKCLSAMVAMQKYLDQYCETGNKELLLDIANYAMIEWMCPEHPNAHYGVNEPSPNAQGKNGRPW